MAPEHANNVTIRPYRPGEEAKMAELVNASHATEFGIQVTPDLIRDEWQDPRLDLARDTRVAVNEHDEFIAATEVWLEGGDEEGAELARHIGFTMHPRYRESHAPLLETLFAQALEHARSHPRAPDKQYHLRAWAAAQDEWKQQWVRAHGFQSAHCVLTLCHDRLDTLLPVPKAEGICIERGAPEREYDLWETLNTIFLDDEQFTPLTWDEWKALYLEPERMEPALWRLAIDEQRDAIVGIALTEMSEAALDGNPTPEGWITDFGLLVDQAQAEPVGQALLLAALHALRDAGAKQVLLGVELPDFTPALSLYKGVGFQVLHGSCIFTRPL